MAPSILVLLAPPCNFAVLVRSMLAGHPQLYDLPALDYLADQSLEAMRAADQDVDAKLSQAVAQLHDGAQSKQALTAARRWLDAHGLWTPVKFLDYVQDRRAPDMAVLWSPQLLQRKGGLQALVHAYPDCNLLHLTRHPTGFALALEEAARDGTLTGMPGGKPDQAWFQPHQRIVEFAAGLPPGQCMRLQVEALLSEPATYLPQIAEWLGLEDVPKGDASMLHPEQAQFYAETREAPPAATRGKKARKSSALLPLSLPEHSLEEAAARGTKFSKPTVKMAKEFGYF